MPLQHSARKTTKLLEGERRIHWTFLFIFSLWELQNSFITKSPWTLNSSFSLLQNHANFSILRAKFRVGLPVSPFNHIRFKLKFWQPLSVETPLIPGNNCYQTPTSEPSKSFKAEHNWGTRHFVLLYGTNTGAERYSYGNFFITVVGKIGVQVKPVFDTEQLIRF